MHLAKGLECKRSVAVMACDDEAIPFNPGSKRSGSEKTLT
jgi:hypothetical protein